MPARGEGERVPRFGQSPKLALEIAVLDPATSIARQDALEEGLGVSVRLRNDHTSIVIMRPEDDRDIARSDSLSGERRYRGGELHASRFTPVVRRNGGSTGSVVRCVHSEET